MFVYSRLIILLLLAPSSATRKRRYFLRKKKLPFYLMSYLSNDKFVKFHREPALNKKNINYTGAGIFQDLHRQVFKKTFHLAAVKKIQLMAERLVWKLRHS